MKRVQTHVQTDAFEFQSLHKNYKQTLLWHVTRKLSLIWKLVETSLKAVFDSRFDVFLHTWPHTKTNEFLIIVVVYESIEDYKREVKQRNATTNKSFPARTHAVII